MVTHSVAEDAGLLGAIDTSSTLDLHQSNLLRMQVSELLEECQLDVEGHKWTIIIQEYFQSLAKAISNVSVVEKNFRELADKPVSVELNSDQSGLSMEPFGCTKARLGWTKKSGNARVLPTFECMVLMPSNLFSGKDYMNYRYFDKRHIVMTKVARALTNKSEKIGKVEFVWINGSNRPPILRLQPPAKKKQSPKFYVDLHFGIKSIDWMPRLRLVPNRNNTKEKGAKSQFYNHCLLYDTRHDFVDEHLKDLLDHNRCFHEALVLLQVWGLQRGLWRNHDGWDKNSVALLMVYLFRTHHINPRMTPIQIFTVVLHHWATTNWLGEEEKERPSQHVAQGQEYQTRVNARRQRAVLVLPKTGYDESTTVKLAAICSQYAKQTEESPVSADDPKTLLEAYSWTDCYMLGPVFLDPTMTYNYLGGVSPNYMKVLVCHAKKSLGALKIPRFSFETLFMQQARFWQQWDLYFRVSVKSTNACGDWEFSARQLLQKLEWGLGNRIHAMRILSNGNGDFSGVAVQTDQYVTAPVEEFKQSRSTWLQSPVGGDEIVVGLSLDEETSQRVVDRGPPSESHDDVKHFLDLWGKRAQLRRFKDGAIVHAVVWNDRDELGFQNHQKWNGGYVEKIVGHLVSLHHGSTAEVVSAFPSFLSTIDSISGRSNFNSDPLSAHRQIIKAFESLSEFLRRSSEQPATGSLRSSSLGLPLPIDAVEPLSPSLRYSELFPSAPHPLLGGPATSGKYVSGAVMFDPILVQVRFGASSKWPTDLRSIGAAKTAMLVQLANGIETCGNKDFDGLISVCPTYADIGYKGYCFRIFVRADPEIQMLQRLVTPSPAALQLLEDLTRRHVLASRHHSTVHAVHTLHPSAASVVRVAMRWVASHLLSGHIGTDLVELIVAKLYSDTSVFLNPPATVAAGFLRLLHLLANHDWAREPLVVDPRGHISEDEYNDIYQTFEKLRGKANDGEPAMYVVASYNRGLDGTDEKWQPSVLSPERVVLSRVVHLAKRSYEYMHRSLFRFDDMDWQAIFRETPASFMTYSVLMRVGPSFVVDEDTSSTAGNLGISDIDEGGSMESSFTRSFKAFSAGPKTLRQKVYRNLAEKSKSAVIPAWQPVQELVATLQKRLGDHAVFFFNEYCPEVIGLVWRPQVFAPGHFSAMSSERRCPAGDEWGNDSFVSRNFGDVLRESNQYSKDIVTSIRIIDENVLAHFSKKQKI